MDSSLCDSVLAPQYCVNQNETFTAQAAGDLVQSVLVYG